MHKMISRKEALLLLDEALKNSKKHAHSIRVSEFMAAFARYFSADEELWRIVGLCHDLDYQKVNNDWSKHGAITSEQLKGKLPAEALQAIAAHSHQSGIQSNTLIAAALRAADALEILSGIFSFETLKTAFSNIDWLSGLHSEIPPEREYLLDKIAVFLDRTGLKPEEMISLIE